MNSSPPETALDRFGRVVVPRSARAELGLEPGARFAVVVEGGEIRLKPIDGEPELVARGGVLVVRSPAEGDLRDALQRSRDERAARVTGRGAAR